jgi:hypothetical protein
MLLVENFESNFLKIQVGGSKGVDSILSPSNILFVVIIPLSFSILPKQTESRDTLKIRSRRKTTVWKTAALKWPSFCVFLCFEMILRSFNGAVMCRMDVAPLEFGRKIINPVRNIKEDLIIVLRRILLIYLSYHGDTRNRNIETEIRLTCRSNFYSKFRPHLG